MLSLGWGTSRGVLGRLITSYIHHYKVKIILRRRLVVNIYFVISISTLSITTFTTSRKPPNQPVMIGATSSIVAPALLLFGLGTAAIVSGFQIQSIRSQVLAPQSAGERLQRSRSVPLFSSSIDENEDFVSPNQIKALRKTAGKLRARKKLVRFAMPEEESFGPFSVETSKAIADLLLENELVEVRGIAKDKKPKVFATTQQLAIDVGIEAEKVVTTVEIKGFAATMYCPGDKITRRTSYREGQWKRKRRPKRDNRGQIITGEYEYFD